MKQSKSGLQTINLGDSVCFAALDFHNGTNGYCQVFSAESNMTCYISVDDDTWVCRSAVDSGANQSVHPERKDFTTHQKLEKPIFITVAKKGITMTAIGHSAHEGQHRERD